MTCSKKAVWGLHKIKYYKKGKNWISSDYQTNGYLGTALSKESCKYSQTLASCLGGPGSLGGRDRWRCSWQISRLKDHWRARTDWHIFHVFWHFWLGQETGGIPGEENLWLDNSFSVIICLTCSTSLAASISGSEMYWAEIEKLSHRVGLSIWWRRGTKEVLS